MVPGFDVRHVLVLNLVVVSATGPTGNIGKHSSRFEDTVQVLVNWENLVETEGVDQASCEHLLQHRSDLFWQVVWLLEILEVAVEIKEATTEGML